MKLTEMSSTVRVLAAVAGKLRAQRDALLSTVAQQMVLHAQELMNKQGPCSRSLLGNAWNISWATFPGEPLPGKNLQVLFNSFLAEINAALAKIEKEVPGLPTTLSPALPRTLRELDDLFACAGTRPTSQALSVAEANEVGLFCPAYKASMVPQSARRIISAYRFEVGDFDRQRREERLFCDLAEIMLPKIDCYFDDVLVHDRDVIYGMSMEQEGVIVAKASGYGTWFYPIVGAEYNYELDGHRKMSLEFAKAIAFVTYGKVSCYSPDAMIQHWQAVQSAARKNARFEQALQACA